MSAETVEGRPVLDMAGPMTVKEVESLVFLAARAQPRFEVSQRTWLEDDRSYFIRWCEGPDTTPPRIIGLVHAYQLPEMASRVQLVGFGDEPPPALDEYAGMLRKELVIEGFA
jgi:hypothetical protein